MPRLTDKVAVVTGSSRGAGRGIALVLGGAGATVYVTGRSVRGAQTAEALPNTTVEDTAEMVNARGGVGIPVRVDHTRDEEVEALFGRVDKERGRLDLLVNNAWGGYEDYAHRGGDSSFDAPFWEQPISRFDKMFAAGVRSHLVATRAALPFMMRAQRGLIVNTTFEVDPAHYDAALFYRTAKLAINYLTFGMAHDLKGRGGYDIAVVGLAPGWMRTEAVMESFRSGLHKQSDLERTESVEYTGRAVLALATDAEVMAKTGKTLRVRDLAKEYGFTDINGRQPD